MAILSDLVAICAHHRLDTEATLGLFSRELREAGRVSKAGRGRGAAKMTFLDAARFLIACAATDHPKRAADAEAVFSSTLSETGKQSSAPLDTALAATLASIADGSLDAAEKARAEAAGLSHWVVMLSLDVFRSGVSAVLHAGESKVTYRHPAAIDMLAAENHETMLALSRAWERETERFTNGKNLHASLDAPLLRAIAHAVAGNER